MTDQPRIRRGRFRGEPVGGAPAGEADHLVRCPACGGWIDCRDLGWVLDHVGPLPHPASDREQ
ncbi:hypothetical protein [Rhodoplanes roseus]|uniref:Uncharacterized protein n=1 Tax=Rhodoplanes roseus TaxID=29409 RepID=A0A327L0U0_9BRAD|nr:hypothetical protein [Rhodoplanes roseus]RAI44690.1 hypothetical protein CH341_07690 [Rhodoplanes roseus]